MAYRSVCLLSFFSPSSFVLLPASLVASLSVVFVHILLPVRYATCKMSSWCKSRNGGGFVKKKKKLGK